MGSLVPTGGAFARWVNLFSVTGEGDSAGGLGQTPALLDATVFNPLNVDSSLPTAIAPLEASPQQLAKALINFMLNPPVSPALNPGAASGCGTRPAAAGAGKGVDRSSANAGASGAPAPAALNSDRGMALLPSPIPQPLPVAPASVLQAPPAPPFAQPRASSAALGTPGSAAGGEAGMTAREGLRLLGSSAVGTQGTDLRIPAEFATGRAPVRAPLAFALNLTPIPELNSVSGGASRVALAAVPSPAGEPPPGPNRALSGPVALSTDHGASRIAIPPVENTPGDAGGSLGPTSASQAHAGAAAPEPTGSGGRGTSEEDSQPEGDLKPDGDANAKANEKVDPPALAADDSAAAAFRIPGLTALTSPAHLVLPQSPETNAAAAAGAPPEQGRTATSLNQPGKLDLAPQPPAAAASGISMRIAPAGAASVEVQVTERAGQLHVAVRTPDAALETSLRRDLNTLVDSLGRAGFRTQSITAGGPSGEDSPAFGSSSGREGNPGPGGQPPPSGSGHGHPQQRQQQPPPRQAHPGSPNLFSLAPAPLDGVWPGQPSFAPVPLDQLYTPQENPL